LILDSIPDSLATHIDHGDYDDLFLPPSNLPYQFSHFLPDVHFHDDLKWKLKLILLLARRLPQLLVASLDVFYVVAPLLDVILVHVGVIFRRDESLPAHVLEQDHATQTGWLDLSGDLMYIDRMGYLFL